ncbi:MAG: hypothetical protein DGJ47_000088 [Rickettsiaceae bacterium]
MFKRFIIPNGLENFKNLQKIVQNASGSMKGDIKMSTSTDGFSKITHVLTDEQGQKLKIYAQDDWLYPDIHIEHNMTHPEEELTGVLMKELPYSE